RAGWRLGQCHFGGDGLAAAAGIARHSHQHGGHGCARCFEGSFRGRAAGPGSDRNMAPRFPPVVPKPLSGGGPPPAGLSPEERHAWDQLDDFYKNGLGYANEMALRPQTLYGLVDSPVGLAGWILDHDIRSYQMS